MSVSPYRGQAGLTLVELLVALAIGLVVLAGAGTIFASANADQAAQSDEAAAEEGGRYALEVIGRAVRQAGYVDWSSEAGANNGRPPPLAGLDAQSLDKASEGITNPLAPALNGSDVLAVHFEGAGKAPSGDGSVLNCAGFAVPAHQEGWSIFYVARGTDGSGELRCKYRGKGSWSADAVVPGVDGFQVLYGLDTDEPADGVPNRYVNASTIDTLDGALALNGSTEAERKQDLNERSWWNRVASVRYALLLRGPKAARGTGGARTYDMFGAAYADSVGTTDPGTRLAESALAGGQALRSRRVYVATVALRGRR
ncbi:MAG: PilW family protein [Telluria sp.]